MFNLLQNASDDQTAIVACLLTLAGATFLVFASFHLGPAGKRQSGKVSSNGQFDLRTQSSGQSPEIHERAA